MYTTLLVAVSASGADLHVGLGSPYTDVTSAIGDAVANDRIVVHPGTYPPFVVSKTVEIVGAAGAAVTIIEADYQQAVRVGGGSPVLRGLTLDGRHQDRALEVASATATLEDVVLVDGSSGSDGGCGWFDASTVTLRRVSVDDCVADNEGGGLYSRQTQLRIEASQITSNRVTAGSGGGIYASGGSVTLIGSLLSGNAADDPNSNNGFGFGGGLYGQTSTVVISGSRFEGNEATSARADGGVAGALRSFNSVLTVDSSVFEGNVATERGSAIAVRGSTSQTDISTTLFEGNIVDEPNAAAAYGGALFCEENAACLVNRAWFEGNEAVDGPAITSKSALTVQTSMFCQNTAGEDAGAIDLGNLDPYQLFAITGSVFLGNTADLEGGAIVARGYSGGFANNHFVDNAAQIGGAVNTFVEYGYSSELVAVNNLYVGNQSTDAAFVMDVPLLYEGFEWFFDNNPSDYGGTPGEGTVLDTDPLLAGATNACNVAPLLPRETSPLLDAGTIELVDSDGSASDIGAFGGPDGDPAAFLDGDGDGWAGMVDCADSNAARKFDAVESCNAVDDDCDGLIDDDDAAVDAAWLHPDADGDGLGNPAVATYRCPALGSWVADASDCNDADVSVGAGIALWVDADGDGLGDASAPLVGCSEGPGVSIDPSDCDDVNPNVGAPHSWYLDDDGDGHGAGPATIACEPPGGDWAPDLGDDCDDAVQQTFPGAPEQCNGFDDDCNGAIDDNVVLIEWWPDLDGDTYGDPDAASVTDCIAPGPDWASRPGDCDDGRAGANPGEQEVCGGGDEDCDGREDDRDESVDPASLLPFYPDEDEDGYGDMGGAPVFGCDAPQGLTSDSTDCDDQNAAIHPGVVEIPYDDIDQDCDGLDADIPVDQDSDADGMTDLVEGSIGADPLDPDSDDDGWTDGAEGVVDTDGDGLADPIDTDDDNDLLPTLEEERGDADDDGTENHLDPDSDNDGVVDGVDGVPLDAGGMEEQRPPKAKTGCTCSETGGRGSMGWMMVLGLLVLRRRVKEL